MTAHESANVATPSGPTTIGGSPSRPRMAPHSSMLSAAHEPVLARVAGRYPRRPRFARHYVSAKLRRDPVHADLLNLAAGERFGRVADVGCGWGQISLLLLEAGLASASIGLDVDGARLAAAEHAGRGLAFTARRQDLAAVPAVPDAQTVLLIDVLYQLARPTQAALLAAASGAARARLILRTPDPDRRGRAMLSRTLEVAFRCVWPNSGARVNPPSVAWICERLDALGFAVEVAPCWRGTPFANVLVIARRR